MLQPYHLKTLMITCDNGKEFADHIEVEKKPNTDVYFYHPYTS